MSAVFDESDDRPRNRDAGEDFLLTFAALGPLVVLAAEKAEASAPVGAAPLSIEEAQELLGGLQPPPGTSALGPPAATDPAFVAALAALNPPFGDSTLSLRPPAQRGTSDLAAPEVAAPTSPLALVGDDAIGSSSSSAALGAGGLALRGDDLVVALASGAKLTISGDNDLLLTSANDVIEVLSGSSVAIQGDGAKVTLGAHDRVSLTGAGYEVRATGANDVVNLQAASQATVYGDGVSAQVAAPSSNLTMIGAGNAVDVASAGANVTVGGAGDPTQAANSVYLNAPATVDLMNASTLAAYGAGAAYLGANDYLSLFGAFDVYASQSAGATSIAAFGGDDTLYVHSSYADIVSLLGGATQASDSTTLNLNSAGDAITLVGLDKAQVTAFALDGRIRLD